MKFVEVGPLISIKENHNFIITRNPALALIPGLSILMVFTFNLPANGLSDATDTTDIATFSGSPGLENEGILSKT